MSAGENGRVVEGGAALPGVSLTLGPEALEAIAQRTAEIVLAQLGEHAGAGEDRWLSTREAAEYAGCSANSLHKAMAAREVEFAQDCRGGKAWFKRSDIDRWRRGG